LAEVPAGLVHLVDALVADVAVAGVPAPVPVVVERVRIERPFRRGAQPQVEVDALRDRAFGLLADRAAPLVAEAARDLDGAQLAFGEEGRRLAVAAARPALRP